MRSASGRDLSGDYWWYSQANNGFGSGFLKIHGRRLCLELVLVCSFASFLPEQWLRLQKDFGPKIYWSVFQDDDQDLATPRNKFVIALSVLVVVTSVLSISVV